MRYPYCGRELSEPYESWLDVSVDHVIPQGTIGQLGYPSEWVEDLINKVTCCQACNGFLSRYPVTDPVPASLNEFLDLRNRHFIAKKQLALERHEKERETYREWLETRSSRSKP